VSHRCHWPGCETPVPPALWGCRPHWFALPKELRDKLWRVYVPGQEIRKDPSAEYLEVAGEIEAWIRARPPRPHAAQLALFAAALAGVLCSSDGALYVPGQLVVVDHRRARIQVP
jgi:hypothetical protein